MCEFPRLRGPDKEQTRQEDIGRVCFGVVRLALFNSSRHTGLGPLKRSSYSASGFLGSIYFLSKSVEKAKAVWGCP